MARLRTTPPDRLAGFEVTVTDLLHERGHLCTDALVFFGGDGDNWVRVVVRPSGTEPKVKSYIEVRWANIGNIEATRVKARAVQDELAAVAEQF
jgi:phosphomannomutase